MDVSCKLDPPQERTVLHLKNGEKFHILDFTFLDQRRGVTHRLIPMWTL